MSEVEYTNTLPLVLPEAANNGILAAVAKDTLSYCLYARKSSEDDERQALSIESQVKEMSRQAESEGLIVTEIRRESHSAKASGTRPVFSQLIQDIRKGLFQGILTWAPDRLSRNAGDLGSIVDLMDNGYLKEIKTHGQTLSNSPNDKFLLMILCSQAKLENDNRRVNVMRGLKTKCEMGFRPNQAPLGYLNDPYSGKGQKTIFLDPIRAPLIKGMFEKVAFEDFSGRDVYQWLKNDVDFRTRGDKPMTVSSVYKTLNNPFYCGMFEYPKGSGKWYKGAHDPIISKQLFQTVQEKMAIHPKSRPGTKEFDFTKLKILKCASCGSGITAQEKIKKSSLGTHRYVYYNCTKVRNLSCKEPFIREEQLIEEFIKHLKCLPIDQFKSNPVLSPKYRIYQSFSALILGQNIQNEAGSIETNTESFVRFIFKEGTREEKRELILSLNTTLYLCNKELVTNLQ